jgi:hypothetical protein
MMITISNLKNTDLKLMRIVAMINVNVFASKPKNEILCELFIFRLIAINEKIAKPGKK